MEVSVDHRDTWSDSEIIAHYGLEARKLDHPLLIGNLQRPGWNGRLPVYLIWCQECDVLTVTHPAGYAGRLQCKACNRRFDHLVSPLRPAVSS